MSVLRWAFPSFFAIKRWIDKRFTPEGKACAAALAVALLLVLHSAQALSQLFAMLAALVLVAAVGNFLFRPRTRARLVAQRAVHCGDEVAATLHLANASRLPAHDLDVKLAVDLRLWQVDEGQWQVALVESGSEALLSARLRPRRRGVFPWPGLTVASTFPFHLLRIASAAAVAGELVVYPYRPPRGALLLGELFLELAGQRVETLARAGDSSHYLGNREYLPGMQVRRWDYRSWARLNRPIVREFEEPQPQSVVLVVDTCLPAQRNSEEVNPRLEAVLSVAAAVIESCAWHGLALEHLVLADRVLPTLPTGPLDEATSLEALARATPLGERSLHDLVAAVQNACAQDAGLAIVVLSRWDSQRAELCQALRETGNSWIGLLVTGETESPPHDLPAEVQAIAWPAHGSPAGAAV